MDMVQRFLIKRELKKERLRIIVRLMNMGYKCRLIEEQLGMKRKPDNCEVCRVLRYEKALGRIKEEQGILLIIG